MNRRDAVAGAVIITALGTGFGGAIGANAQGRPSTKKEKAIMVGTDLSVAEINTLMRTTPGARGAVVQRMPGRIFMVYEEPLTAEQVTMRGRLK